MRPIAADAGARRRHPMSTDNDRGTTDQESEQETETVRTNWRGYTHPTTAVVERVEAATGRPVTSLPALHESVDTDALDALLTGVGDGEDPVQVSFSYVDLWVTVRSDRTMVLSPGE